MSQVTRDQKKGRNIHVKKWRTRKAQSIGARKEERQG